MQPPSYPDIHFQHTADPATRNNAKAVKYEVVEISSDEGEGDDTDDGQPESSTRANCVSPTNKRTVIIDGDYDSPDEALEIFQHGFEPIRGKRLKLDHTPSPEDTKAAIDLDEYMDWAPLEQSQSTARVPVPQSTSVDPSVAGIYDGDDSAAFMSNDVVRQATDNPPMMKKPRQRKSEFVPIEVEINKSKVKLEIPPYYNDNKYDARMYCGPGFEKFSVVVGTVPEHQDICDEWDRVQGKVSTLRKQRQACRAELARYVNNMIDADSSDEDDDETIESRRTALELECLHKVREVLPDVQRKFALEKVRNHIETYVRNIAEDVQIQPSPSLVVNQILELTDYPKQEKRTEAKEPAADGTGVTIEWRKGDTESKTYSRDAVCLLAGQFDYVPTHFISKVVQEKKSLYDSFFHLQDLEANYHSLNSKDRLYRRSHNPRVLLEKKYTAKENDFRPRDQWENLVNEMQAARQKTERDKIRTAKDLEDRAMEEANLEDHRASGNLVECQCCFDDEIPVNRAVSCEDKDVHWFCFACILRLAEDRIGSMKFEMACMHQSGCKASLIKEGIRRAIPQKMIDKLAFYQQQSEITAACIEGLEQCPFCDFKAICDPIEETVVFQCQNPDCKRVTCRKCHEDSHLPKTCEEFKNDKRISARHQVEEARSEAMMRPCPKCKVKIIKEIGCNKMRCSMCGCLMCYVCKMDISTRKDGGYGHFNEAGARCALYDKNFDRHEAEANEAEREAIKKVQAENGDIDEKQLQIETNKQPENITAKADKYGHRVGRIAPRNVLGAAGNNAFEAAMRQHQVEFPILQRAAQRRRAEPEPAPPAAAADWLQQFEAREAQDPLVPPIVRIRPAAAMLDDVLELHHRLNPAYRDAQRPTTAELLNAHHRQVQAQAQAQAQAQLHALRQRQLAQGGQATVNQTQQPGGHLFPELDRPWPGGARQQEVARGINGLDAHMGMAPLLHHNPRGGQVMLPGTVQNAGNPMALANVHNQQLMNMQHQQVQPPLANNLGGLDGMLAPWHWNGMDLNNMEHPNGAFEQHVNGWHPNAVFRNATLTGPGARPQTLGQANHGTNVQADAGLFDMRF